MKFHTAHRWRYYKVFRNKLKLSFLSTKINEEPVLDCNAKKKKKNYIKLKGLTNRKAEGTIFVKTDGRIMRHWIYCKFSENLIKEGCRNHS